ncbi:MAG: hypothetical protein IJ131_10950 [Eggerthellaceae bacterium]|nr:hypothetical protein [Eggerthellaceae bacterium]
MKKSNYARLFGFANTTAGKIVSILVAITRVFTLTSAVYAASEAFEAYANGDQTSEQQQDLPDIATVAITVQNCVDEIGGQQVEGTGSGTPGSPVSFTVVPNDGYQIFSVGAFDDLGALPVDGGSGSYSIDGGFVYGALSVEAIAASDPNNPQDSTGTTIIEEGSVVDDGQIAPGQLYPAPTIILEDNSRPYNATPLDFAPYTTEGLQPEDVLTVDFEGSQTEIGSSPISVSGYTIWRGENDVTALYEQAQLPTATLTVTKIPVQVVTPSATKPYDGTPLTYEGSWDEGDAATVEVVLDQESIEFDVDFNVVGSQTEVGSSPNTYELIWKAGNPDFFEITEDLGTLTVTTAQEAIYAIAPSASKVYDGKPLDAGSITWDGLPEGCTGQASFTGSLTNAGKATTRIDKESVRILDANSNDVTAFYNVETIDGELVIDKASLSVFTESASKDDDGTPLTAAGAIGGFVNGETATFTVLGAQVGVGSSSNGYRIDWNGTAKPENYTVYEDLGTLEIAAITPVVVIDADYVTGEPNIDNGSANTSNGDNNGAGSGAGNNNAQTGDTPAANGGAADGGNNGAPAQEPDPAPVQYEPGAPESDSGSDAGATYVAPAAGYTYDNGASYSPVPTTVSTPTSVSTSTPSSTAGAGSSSASSSSEASDASNDEEGINPVVGAVATGMQNLEQVVTGEEPSELIAPALEEEVLEDDATPLGVFDEPVSCWVHWYAILGLIATAIYGAVVMFFRRAYSYELESREAAVLGVPVSTLQPQVPASAGDKAGREA